MCRQLLGSLNISFATSLLYIPMKIVYTYITYPLKRKKKEKKENR